jgi:choline dehydrogenase-like flavoprotein
MRVLVLEAGRPRKISQALHLRDRLWRRLGYVIEEDPAAVRRQPVQSSCYAWPNHPHAFVDDLDNPYLTNPDDPFAWIRSRQVGGRMLVQGHGLQFYRFSDLDFKAGERDGASPSWPLSYADLAPYYDRVERWMRIRGTCDRIPHLPDAVLAGERPLNAIECQLKKAVERTWKDRSVICGRTASPPFPIRDALATGRCRLRTNAIVSHLIVDHSQPKVKGVAFVDRRTHRTREVTARIVVLCASAIESARLLLASATREHPEGLANSSGAVGRYLMDHTHLTGIHGIIPLKQPVPTPAWAYIPRFRNVTGQPAAFIRGYGVQVFTMWRACAVTSFGEMLPHPDNRVTLDRTRTDKWGIPIVRIDCSYRENERSMIQDQVDACVEMLRAADIELLGVNSEPSRPGVASHEVGTGRMGNDPKTSVLNSFCQSWDVKNLFVMDGSCFVTLAVQNPTLTMLALAARACDYVLECRRRGDL